MSKAFTELQELYLAGLDDMSPTDAATFLALLKADEDAPFRAERIPRLERHIEKIKRKAGADEAWKAIWIPLALEDKATKDRWLSVGATWICNGYTTKWSYKGTEFYRWHGGFNRPSVVDEIKNVRKADEKLTELIREKEAIA